MGNKGRKGGLRAGAASVALLATIGLTAGPVAAQDVGAAVSATDEDARETTLELTGSVGLVLPMSVLGAQGDTLQADLSTKPAFAAELDVWFAGGFGLGLAAGFTSPELSISTADAGMGSDPPRTCRYRTRSSVRWHRRVHPTSAVCRACASRSRGSAS